MKKTCRFELRLSQTDFEILTLSSKKFDMSTTQFVTSIVIPWCFSNSPCAKCLNKDNCPVLLGQSCPH